MAIPVAPIAIGAGLSALGGLFGGGKSKRSKELDRRFDSALDFEGDQSKLAADNLNEFDAQEGLGRFARGAFETFRHDLDRDLGDLRGRQVGAGRLDTGFATEDGDRMIEFGLRDLNRQILGGSLSAQGQQLAAIGMQNQSRDRFLELLTAGQDRSTADDNSRRGFDDFLSSAAKIGGTVLPFF